MNSGEIGQAWTDDEIAAIVESYFGMLRRELVGESYNKAEENRQLQALTGRSKGAIEFKHCNISAVLQGLKSFYIEGYKPRSNVQAALREAVVEHWVRDSALQQLMLNVVGEPVLQLPEGTVLDMAPPPNIEVDDYAFSRHVVRHDFVRLEAEKRGLGHAGELAVVEFEQRRLHNLGQKRLAERVDHVSATQGDGLGFDVLSFETDGQERLIEVKTTRRVKEWPFLVTRNELQLSRDEPERFYLYRVFQFCTPRPCLYTIRGVLDASCALAPTVYEARPSIA
ncbi:DUF3883 domain-containing protein [Arthrobacter sp. I2-34]|uniref:DUF3883 domain-containing protein n=1 Tax=Arthrobacter hankyongi TaxID=2904801 RepID=A0ABS9L2J1_9MICC|nr:DUF3883 domain-containing protein [Arthrobacter hankyongi]MCG2620860.1 DUF3883 domain-containing protein [Arthrobacter hankyongi]